MRTQVWHVLKDMRIASGGDISGKRKVWGVSPANLSSSLGSQMKALRYVRDHR